MSLDLDKAVKSSGKKDFGRVEEGTHCARIAQVVDIGLQHLTDWVTQKPKYHELDGEGKWLKNGNDFVFTTEPNDSPDIKPQVLLTYEFPTERVEIKEESLPRWMSKEYTISTHEKAGLMKLIAAIAPGTTKLGNLINKAAFVSVGTTSGGNAKIEGVAAPMKGVPIADLENEEVTFSFDKPDMVMFNKLPAFIQNKIKAATNYEGSEVQRLVDASQSTDAGFDQPDSDFDDEIPY